jgi:epoxyqueuosine reductase
MKPTECESPFVLPSATAKEDDRAIAIAELAERLKQSARDIGFDLVGITSASSPVTLPRFHEWLDRGFAGEMAYLERRRAAYEHPAGVLPQVQSVIVLGTSYASRQPEPESNGDGRIARYARIPADYHTVLRERLKELAAVLHQACPGCRTRGVVDTAPLLERDFAQAAGLGWFGKNTMLIHKRAGSWLLLSALLTDVDLPADAPHETAHCGTCTRCLDACPTDAFPAPYVLDARRCISYLTIELGPRPIETDLLSGMQDWAFGCDVCQEVCPWNRKAPEATTEAFHPQPALSSIGLEPLLEMGPLGFEARYAHTPLERPGYEALVRNCCVAAGNSGRLELLPSLRRAETHHSPLVRDAAAWAIRRLTGAGESASAGQAALTRDSVNAECADAGRVHGTVGALVPAS